MEPQHTHNYHPIVKATAEWEAFATAMQEIATRSPEARASDEAARRRHSAAADAAWTPPKEGP